MHPSQAMQSLNLAFILFFPTQSPKTKKCHIAATVHTIYLAQT